MKNENRKIVYIVHCVDTEGPLYESLEETFARLKYIYGIELDPTRSTLEKIQKGCLDLGGKEHEIKRMFAAPLLEYKEEWSRIDEMLKEIMSNSFRNEIPDSYGRGWVYNWHCVDHVGYSINKRRKDIGIHNIFDHYTELLRDPSCQDLIHWHFHPISHHKISHYQTSGYINQTYLHEILCRRIIDKNWFPSVNRSGFHIERPDIHWFLEQWIPFDLSNLSTEQSDEQDDLSGGRFHDWRRSPKDWRIYHPDHDDYQKEGSCRRAIGRCLNIGTRHSLLTETEMEKAFERADRGQPTLMAFTNHDFREMRSDLREIKKRIQSVSKRYSDVRYKYSDARQAFVEILYRNKAKNNNHSFQVKLDKITNDRYRLGIKFVGQNFCPQPYLAVKTSEGRYYHDNLDFEKPFLEWTYTFDRQTLPLSAIDTIAVATNDIYGISYIRKIYIGHDIKIEMP